MSLTKGTPASSQIVWLEGRVKELEGQIDSISRERARMAVTNKALLDEIHQGKVRINELQIRTFARFSSDECWIWQGDGEDHLESLVCPVVISPADLAKLIAKAAP